MSSGGLIRMFIYGTLKRGQPNHYVMTDPKNGRATFVCCGWTQAKYPLVIATEANIPTVLVKEEGLGHNIHGEVWDVDNRMRETLDEFEGYPDYYNRVHIKVLTEEPGGHSIDSGREETCFMYAILDYNRRALLRLQFFSDYDSLGDHGLPYLAELDDDPDMNAEDL